MNTFLKHYLGVLCVIFGLITVTIGGDIHDGALNGAIDKIDALLKSDPSLAKYHDSALSDSTPLHLAAMNGHITVVETLLTGGADINAKDCGGWTPLMRAVANRRTNVVQRLLTGGAKVNTAMDIGRTALHYAVMNDDANIAAVLLSYKADGNSGSGGEYDPPPLHIARSTVMVELLLANKADIEATDQAGETALHKAALFNLTDIVKTLISHKADVNAKDRRGRTPLQRAAWRHSAEAAILLLDNGANVAIRDEKGKSALQIAKERGYKDMVDLFEQYGSKDIQ